MVAILQSWRAPTSYSANFDGGNGSTFEIAIPSDLCPHAVLGDLESPQGDTMANATLSTIHDTLSALSPTDQTTYLSKLLTSAITALQAELDALVCSEASGGSRTLLWDEVSPQDMKGWTCWISGVPLTFGIIFATAMVPNGWSPYNVTLEWPAKSSILAAGGVVESGLIILWTRLQAGGKFKDADAYFANFFIAAANLFTSGLRSLGRACVSLESVRQGLINLYNKCLCCGPLAFGNPNNPANPGVQALPAGNQAAQPVQPVQPVQPEAEPQQQPAAVLPEPEC